MMAFYEYIGCVGVHGLYLPFSYSFFQYHLGLNLTQDPCCFPEANSTEVTCNITIDALPSSTVGEERSLKLKLDRNGHNLVCNQSQLIVTVAGVWNTYMPGMHASYTCEHATDLLTINYGTIFFCICAASSMPATTTTITLSDSTFISIILALVVLLLSSLGACVLITACICCRSRRHKTER